MARKNRLKKIMLDEVSLVRAGANAGARVLLHKSEDRMPQEKDNPITRLLKGLRDSLKGLAEKSIPDEDERTSALEAVDKGLEEVQKALESEVPEEHEVECQKCGAVAKVDEKDIAKASMKCPKCGATMQISKADPPEDEDPPVEDNSVTKALQSRIAKAEEDARNANERVAKLQEQIDQNGRIEKAGKLLGKIPGASADDFASVLKGLTPEQEKSLTKVLKAANALIDQSGILTEIGKRQPPTEDSPEGRLEKRVSEIQKSEKCTREQAIAKAYAENPEIYDEIEAER